MVNSTPSDVHIVWTKSLLEHIENSSLAASQVSATQGLRPTRPSVTLSLGLQVPRRGPRQPPQRHVAHRHHLPERRLRRHRSQHLLWERHRRQHGDHGK